MNKLHIVFLLVAVSLFVGKSAYAGPVLYWNLFESSPDTIDFVTYSSLIEMQTDFNPMSITRTSISNGYASGSDGSTYWTASELSGGGVRWDNYALYDDMVLGINLVSQTALLNTTLVGSGAYVATTIPEPSSVILLSIGLAGLGFLRRTPPSPSSA